MADNVRSLDPHSAAEEIRAAVTRAQIPVELRHSHAFVIQVCEQLGIDPDPINFIAVMNALHDAGIQPYKMVEFPEMYVIDGKPVKYDDGRIVTFADQAEKDEIMAWQLEKQENGTSVVVEPDDEPVPVVDPNPQTGLGDALAQTQGKVETAPAKTGKSKAKLEDAAGVG